jgi:hypothetical protein
MTELELITTARAAGAGVGAKDTASSMVKDARWLSRPTAAGWLPPPASFDEGWVRIWNPATGQEQDTLPGGSTSGDVQLRSGQDFEAAGVVEVST